MSKLKIKKLQRSDKNNLLTIQESCSIVGGNNNIIIESSFNDIVIGGSGDDVIITDPLQVNVAGREIFSLKDFI